MHIIPKSLTKKLTAKAKQKDCQELGPWIKSISNHVWWAAQNCKGDETMLIEMIQSITHHVCNVHTWNSGERFHRCAHEDLPPDEASSKKLDNTSKKWWRGRTSIKIQLRFQIKTFASKFSMFICSKMYTETAKISIKRYFDF